MKRILLIGSLALLSPFAVHADDGATCASPAPLATISINPSTTTCGGEIGINMGGVVYGHPSRVYSFHVNQPGMCCSIQLTGTNREGVVTRSCTEAPTAISAPGFPINVNALADGEWLYVVSTDPSLPITNPPTCGPFTISYLLTEPDDRIFAYGFG